MRKHPHTEARRLSLCCAIVGYAASALSQIWITASVPKTNWYSVASSADGMTVIAGAIFGSVCTSKDGGATWQTNLFLTNAIWPTVASAPDGVRLAAFEHQGALAQLYLSTNAGTSWSAPSIPAHPPGGVFCSPDGSMLLVPRGNMISLSRDWGQAWTNFSWPDFAMISFSTTGSRMVAQKQGPNSPIYFSTNYGLIWFTGTVTNDFPGGVAMSGDGTTIIASSFGWSTPGNVYISKDSGATWTTTSLPPGGWSPLCCSIDGIRMAACINRDIWISEDAGINWKPTGYPGAPQYLTMSADGCRLTAVSQYTGISTLALTPHPRLEITQRFGEVFLSWIIPSQPFTLEQTADLSATNWTAVGTEPVLNPTNLHNEVALPVPAKPSFYRLRAY